MHDISIYRSMETDIHIALPSFAPHRLFLCLFNSIRILFVSDFGVCVVYTLYIQLNRIFYLQLSMNRISRTSYTSHFFVCNKMRLLVKHAKIHTCKHSISNEAQKQYVYHSDRVCVHACAFDVCTAGHILTNH